MGKYDPEKLNSVEYSVIITFLNGKKMVFTKLEKEDFAYEDNFLLIYPVGGRGSILFPWSGIFSIEEEANNAN